MAFQTRRLTEETPPRRRLPWQALALGAASLGRLLLSWYRSRKAQQAQKTKERHYLLILKRMLTVLLSVLLALLLFAGVVRALVHTRILSLSTLFSVAGADLRKDEHGFTNILLLGKGDESHEGTDLTDTLILASLDPSDTRSALLLSIPRDLYVLQTERMGKGRINELYRDYKTQLRRTEGIEPREASKRAMEELGGELGRKLGIQVHYVVLVDFSGFVQAVDALGGVDIDVPEDIVDREYPGPNYTYETFEIRRGPNHLDGETALKYVRSRHTSNDFGRSARQQQVLRVLGEQAKQQGILQSARKITSILKIIANHTETTMRAAEILGAAKAAERIDKERIITLQLNDLNGLYEAIVAPGGFLYAPPRDQFQGASVLLPVSIPEFPVTWKQLQTLLALLFKHRAVYLARQEIAILNAGGKPGVARSLGKELIRYGFAVTEMGNARDEDDRTIKTQQASFVIAKGEESRPLAAFLAALLQMPLQDPPAGFQEEAVLGVGIVLGTEYAYRPLQDLLAPRP